MQSVMRTIREQRQINDKKAIIFMNGDDDNGKNG